MENRQAPLKIGQITLFKNVPYFLNIFPKFRTMLKKISFIIIIVTVK